MNITNRPAAKYGDENADAQLQIRLPSSLKGELVQCAKDNKMKLTELVIVACNNYLQSFDPDSKRYTAWLSENNIKARK